MLDYSQSLPPRFTEYIRQLRSPEGRRRMNTYPGLTSQPQHDAQRFAIAHDLESHAAEIIAEAHSLDKAAFLDERENIGRTGRWRVCFLIERGDRNESNCRICPVTTETLDRYRSVATMCGMVYFSSLDPDTHVASHKGPTNMRLRCHFGIDIPDGCGLRVNGKTVTWKPRRCIVFDDSFEHEVWNFGDRPRTILVIDLWHPDLSEEEIELLDGLQRYRTGHRRRVGTDQTR